jgi:hypothetical protein
VVLRTAYSQRKLLAGSPLQILARQLREKERIKMKYLTLFLLILGLAISAAAQATINFANLPDVSTPSPLPNAYGGVNWSGVFYVDPLKWAGAGNGFKHTENMAGTDVAFAPYACGTSTCYASISSQDGKAFLLRYANAAGGYGSNPLIVTAYNHGAYVGTQRYMMTTNVQELDFPPSWGGVTQVVFQGSVVFYDLSLYLIP